MALVSGTTDKLHTEEMSKDFWQSFAVKQLIFQGKSAFQQIEVIDTNTACGKILILDNMIQDSDVADPIYHETIVHPTMLAHPNPKTVFVGGGGEGSTIREVLRHKSVEKVVMVDIDALVIDVCKRHLPQWNRGSFDDPRVQLHFEDGKAYLENSTEQFDVVILDFCDPIEESELCRALYTKEFYETVKRRMTPGGVLITQSGYCDESLPAMFSPVHHTLKSVFANVSPIACYIPSFCCTYGFNIASDNESIRRLGSLSAEEVDASISSRIAGPMVHYDGITHRNISSLSRQIRQLLESCTRIITVDNPVVLIPAAHPAAAL
jgi:spermidine synthase